MERATRGRTPVDIRNKRNARRPHLIQGGRPPHQLVRPPHGRGRVRRPSAQPRLGGHPLDQVGLEERVVPSRPSPHQFQRSQDEVRRIRGHPLHVAGEFVGVAFRRGQAERVAEADRLEERGEVVKSVGALADDSEEEVDFAGAEERQGFRRRRFRRLVGIVDGGIRWRMFRCGRVHALGWRSVRMGWRDEAADRRCTERGKQNGSQSLGYRHVESYAVVGDK
mmetsp:Transcript_40581/g.86423  ORF Transcript_40581/g.86423 Transcript_40581/m.86423 type:complete len:223 (+) Transcript_40581:262-930(+)